MKPITFILIILSWTFVINAQNDSKLIIPSGTNICDRFQVPQSYKRIEINKNSFANYLRNLKLKPHGSKVTYFNGGIKDNYVYDAVINLPIGNKDLHQCADAIMRLKAEYLWNTKQYDKIHFNFTNGFKVEYKEWMKGRRMIVKGNKTKWNNRSAPSNTYEDFWEYMELIFLYAGTSSLSKELKSVKLNEMQIGDTFIKGGFPGHAIIVLDMAINESGKKIYLLGQSYMPAQEIQVLKNLDNLDMSPWYELDSSGVINTPEWTFYDNQLKRF